MAVQSVIPIAGSGSDRTVEVLKPRRFPRRATSLVASIVLGGVGVVTFVSTAPDSRPASSNVSVPPGPVPTRPAVTPVCGRSEVLDGPSTPPVGAVRVDPGQDLGRATQDHPSGTTFWLASGIHTLADSEYAQVIAKAGNHYVGAPGAALDGRHINRYAFTPGWPEQARDVTISHLTIRNFKPPPNEGVVNHGAGSGWVIERNTIRDNGGAGVIFGSDNTLRYNCLAANGQYGFSGYRPQLPVGSSITNVVIDHNEIAGNNTEDWEARIPGCGCTGGGKFWDVANAKVTNNWVHHNHGPGFWADTNDIDFLFEGNTIEDNDGHAIFYEISYNASIRNNLFARNALVNGREFQSRGDPFPIGAIYISEAGGDERLAGAPTIDISANTFDNNWGGVVLWENANRFCNSPANTSAGYCTPFANHAECTSPTVNSQPRYGNCRWKTQNVTVHDNLFVVDREAIGCHTDLCGRQAILSNWGTYPDWSPYDGDVISKAVTFDQGNTFTNNTYIGPWRFTAFDMSRDLSPAAWQAAPYGQDAGSSFG